MEEGEDDVWVCLCMMHAYLYVCMHVYKSMYRCVGVSISIYKKNKYLDNAAIAYREPRAWHRRYEVGGRAREQVGE